MLRRLGVAQALIHDPRVLLLDEPTAGLAPEERARLRSLLAETAVDRLVVLATQRPDDIEAVCARVAVLDGGKLLYLGTARDLVERAQGKVFLAELPEGALAELRRRFRVVSVVEHGRRCVARFLDPEGAPGVGRADRPGLRRRISALPERGRAGMSLFRLEFLRVCRSASYIAAVTALVLIAYFQNVFPPSARIVAAGAEITTDGMEACVLAAEDYALARDVDRFSGAHARLFASRVGGALAVLSAFPAAALFWHDRRGCRAAVYARSVSSWKLVFCRYAALTAAMALPVAVMALTLTCVAAMDYGPANVDMLAYGKYALFWILPTIAALYGRRSCCPRR